ncbi:hypothetical protein IZ6_19830 [Terrihabitans soli]|uniref:MmgE/PrpD family protein n=1 Tax=Terrihabitans soli TaxID=708113 RepID=A0A6S6QXG4_9HYPH|nr:MmgE/PrpD family protein [Terrihabitans soli]BCJ91248.1 hypothetical protein IZ6_19830 [Terrihabitans soli]
MGSVTAQRATSVETGRGDRIASFVAEAGTRDYPSEIIHAAKLALVDYFACAIGGSGDPAARSTKAVAEQWKAPGAAQVIRGGKTNPAMAALVNGTMAHCQDYDDTHIGGAGHISAPVWSAALAVGGHRGSSESAVLSAFITGYEVMAHLGTGGIRGIGRNMQQCGFHPTGVNGVVGAAAASATLLGFDEERSANALSAAATSAAGFVASFGSDSKPYHAGRSAMNGILAADLAAEGFVAAKGLFEVENGMLDALIQDRRAIIPEIDFSDGWELLNNGYKPFACCRATHASITAAHKLTEKVRGRKIARVESKVHYNAPFTAGKTNPQSPLECKFSVPFCIAAALCGYKMVAADFDEPMVWDPAVRAILPKVELKPQREQPQFEAYMDVWLEDGEHLQSETKLFLGHPQNPMSTEQFQAKFMSLVEPSLGGKKAERLFATLMKFDERGALAETMNLVSA